MSHAVGVDRIEVPCETGEAVVVTARIGQGRKLRIGSITIAWQDGVVAVMGPRPGVSVTVAPADADGRTAAAVAIAPADGPVVELIDEGEPRREPPLVRTGPGGEYVREVRPARLRSGPSPRREDLGSGPTSPPL